MKGIIAHEWLEPSGGAEKVVAQMAELYSDAEVLALWNDGSDVPIHRVRETWLAKTPLRRHKALAMPFMLPTWRQQEIGTATWALISSHLFAHHIKFVDTKHDVEKFVYVHTPARYIWEPNLDRRGASHVGRIVSPILQKIDFRRAKEGAKFAANSAFVRDRIRRTWDEDAVVIHPPVDVLAIQSVGSWAENLTASDEQILNSLPSEFILGASRFVPYKKVEIAIQAAEAAGVPAVIAGSGPEANRLHRLGAEAKVPVHFVSRPSNELLYALYERAIAFVFMPVEDFGIMPVEAMAVGTPVICGMTGGVTESVVDDQTGIHLDEVSSISLKAAVSVASNLDRSVIRQHAVKFDAASFRSQIVGWTGKPPVHPSETQFVLTS